MSTPDWFFYQGGPSAPRYGGDPTKHAISHDTESFVREVLQNANDQGLPNGDPVEVRFRFLSLSGDQLDEFKEALHWEDLRDHIGAVAGEKHGRGYSQFLAQLGEGDDESLRLLVVEDRNTTGLTGGWDEDGSNFTALVRDELFSHKQDETAGGSYGLGKSVLWTFSGASTVVFNSTLSEEPTDAESPRLIARTKLPTHSLSEDGPEYQGAGWFCRTAETEDGTRPASVWDGEAAEIADSIGLRRSDGYGTSAMVVGYRDPTRDTRPDLADLADEFIEASVKYFWPAMERGDLRVVVETPDEARAANVDQVPMVRPFVECYSQRYEADDSLEAPGDVAASEIGVELPDRDDDTPTEDGPVSLSARMASPVDDASLLNHVALFRGAGMVVKYYDQSRVAFGDRNFHAVLAAGEARTDDEPTDADLDIERFLRSAEPPTHDDWESTENLRERYKQGYRKALDNMMADLRESLRGLISKSVGEGRKLPENVLNQFPIHGQGRRTPSVTNRPAFDLEGTTSFVGGQWEFEGSIEPENEEHDGWTATISLTGLGEDGRTVDRVPLEVVRVDSDEARCELDEDSATIRARPGAGRVTFSGHSRSVGERDFGTGRVGATRLDVRTEMEIGGEE